MIRKYINQNMTAHAWNIRLSFSLFFLSLCNVISGHMQLRKKVNIRAIILLSETSLISLSKVHLMLSISRIDNVNRIKWDSGKVFRALFQFQKILLIFIIYCLYIKLL